MYSMTLSNSLRAVANQHFKADARPSNSTFAALTSAAQLMREKTARLRELRMEREDAAAAIQRPVGRGNRKK